MIFYDKMLGRNGNNFVGVFYFFSSTMGERDNDKLLEEIDKWIH